jgi:hypothetical protein
MTFADKLKALREKATPGKWVSRPEFGARDSEDWEIAPAGPVTSYSAPAEMARFWNYEGKNKHNADLITHLVNRAEELEALVRAAEDVVTVLDSNDPAITDTVWVPDGMPETLRDRVASALAALDKEKT